MKDTKKVSVSFIDFMNDSSTYFLGFTKSKNWVGAIIDLFGIFVLVANQNNNFFDVLLEGLIIWIILVCTMFYFWKKRAKKVE